MLNYTKKKVNNCTKIKSINTRKSKYYLFFLQNFDVHNANVKQITLIYYKIYLNHLF